jgi:hypothetical protein
MTGILEKLKSVHDKQEKDLTPVDVPEYGETWYFRPMTLADQAAAREGVNLKSASAEQQLMVNGLMRMALDANGNRVFDVPTNVKAQVRAELHRMPLEVMLRIGIRSSGVPEAASAELASLDDETVRPALAAVFADFAPLLAGAIAAVDFDVLRQALADVAQRAEDTVPVKNA